MTEIEKAEFELARCQAIADDREIMCDDAMKNLHRAREARAKAELHLERLKKGVA